MSVAYLNPARDPATLLRSIADQNEGEIEQAFVIVKMKSGEAVKWSTSVTPEFLCVTATIVSDLATRSVFGCCMEDVKNP